MTGKARFDFDKSICRKAHFQKPPLLPLFDQKKKVTPFPTHATKKTAGAFALAVVLSLFR
jgi:hypothetical protein